MILLRRVVCLVKNLRDKGCPESLIQEAYSLYLLDIPSQRDQGALDQSVRFTTRFHYDHKKMESILKKHWPILLEDLQLKTLPKFPKVTYRRAPNIKNKIAPSKLKPLSIQPIPRICLLPLYGLCCPCHLLLCRPYHSPT